MVIRVNVRFLGIFQHISGKKHFQVNLEEGATIGKVVMKLTDTFSNDFKRVLVDPQLDDPRPNALILVGGKEIGVLQGLETQVNDAEEIVFIPMVHGG
jgi:MoaD family protein